MGAGGIQGASVAAASAPNLADRRTEGTTNALRYLTLDTTSEPFDDPKVREAMHYAVNKETLQAARGGAKAGGEIVHQILVPGLPGRKDFRVFEAPDQGDPEKAKALLAEAGFPNGFEVTMATTNVGKGKAIGEAVQAALARVNVKVNLRLLDPANYYTEIGKPAENNGIALAGWGPDWPNASTVIPPLFDGRQIKPEGNQIFTELNDPAINAAIDAASEETDAAKQAEMWGDLDEQIMKTGSVIPFTVDRSIYVTGSKVKNLFIHPFYGEPDAVALAVEK
jgi:peptide/nickel transport system substrate-binding protein